MSGLKNKGGMLPFAFRPGPVTILSVLVYGLILSFSIYVHHAVPVPKEGDIPSSVSLDQAWRNLQTLSKNFHPFNSHENDAVRAWLLSTVQSIIEHNNASYEVVTSHALSGRDETPFVTVYDDKVSNALISRTPSVAAYFEGNNIMVRIRGSGSLESGAVLVNAHFDSVSTGYGATDDGVGIVSILQLLRHFTTPGNKPYRDVILLLNNGEEDHLQGAFAFLNHPLSRLARTFVNLEGAGAGGRALLFRSTDYEVTKKYASVPHPLGTVVTRDGFERGLVRSQTDFVVFNGLLGLRGVDIAFYGPRSRYHSAHDSTRSTSPDSVWHMLSAALETTSNLADDRTPTFDGPDFKNGRVDSGHGASAVWWDFFGLAFVIFKTQNVFVLSIVMLVLAPAVLLAIHLFLVQIDRWYLFDTRKHRLSLDAQDGPDGLDGFESPPSDDGAAASKPEFHFNGARGFFRTPVSLALGCLGVYGMSTLVLKTNPYVVYSHEYTVWALMLSTLFIILWGASYVANYFRPSGLVRVYSLVWLFSASWVLLLANAVMTSKLDMAGGYPIVILFLSLLLATLISYLDFFSVVPKRRFLYYLPALLRNPPTSRSASRPSSANRLSAPRLSNPSTPTLLSRTGVDENTPLNIDYTPPRQVPVPDPILMAERKRYDVYGKEQLWSGTLPKWTWILQFLILVPVNLATLSNLGLVITTSLHQTMADGSPVLPVYQMIGALAVLLVVPLIPFIHRVSYHIPALLSVALVGLVTFVMLAAPFDANSQLVVRFIQNVDLDTGVNTVQIRGLDGYVQDVVRALPSALSHQVTCETPPVGGALVATLKDCTWPGLAPRVLDSADPSPHYGELMSLNTRRVDSKSDAYDEAIIELYGNQTRGCRLLFDQPIVGFAVITSRLDSPNPGHLLPNGSLFPGLDDYHYPTPRLPKGSSPEGVNELRLWSRDWDTGWAVKVRWPKGKGQRVEDNFGYPARAYHSQHRLDGEGDEDAFVAGGHSGRALCFWSDQNDAATIPALSEVRAYIPAWTTVIKMDDGLVNGVKRFRID